MSSINKMSMVVWVCCHRVQNIHENEKLNGENYTRYSDVIDLIKVCVFVFMWLRAVFVSLE